METIGARPSRGHCRKPRRITASYLERVALHHLGRFAASAAALERVLLRRVARSARFFGADPADGHLLVTALIERLKRVGLLDDRRLAEARARTLRERGFSRRAIVARLRHNGLGAPEIEAALASLAGDNDDTELDAALTLARRRRLGPFRSAEQRRAYRAKDVAALVRAGFSFAVAKRVATGQASVTVASVTSA